MLLHLHTAQERILILGTNPFAWQIAALVEASPTARATIIGFVEESVQGDQSAQYTTSHTSRLVLGNMSDIDQIVQTARPDRIIVALAERRGHLPVRDLLQLRTYGVLIEDGIEVYERYTQKLAIESLPPSYLLFSPDFSGPKVWLAARQVVSICVALLGLLISAPIMLLVAVVIKLDSRGPVFFIQERVGLRGRIFRLIKFRTMHPEPSPAAPPSSQTSSPPSPPPTLDTAAEADAVWNRDDQNRITRAGKWLRKLYLDELPQFFNILKGDMDLIGPRPEMAANVKTMTEQIPYYFLRNMVRPGLTGWAQVNSGYAVGQEEVTEKMRYDLYYIKRMSPWFDLQILIETAKKVLGASGGSQATPPPRLPQQQPHPQQGR